MLRRLMLLLKASNKQQVNTRTTPEAPRTNQRIHKAFVDLKKNSVKILKNSTKKIEFNNINYRSISPKTIS